MASGEAVLEKLSPYFSFKGRTNRQLYWFTVLCAYAAVLVGVFAVSFIPVVGPIAGAIGFVLLIWVALAAAVRRLHDRNKSGWWLVAMYLPIAVLGGLSGVMSRSEPEAAAAVNLLTLPFSLWILIELGFLRGTSGANRFGPDPLQPPAEVFS